MRSLDQAAGKLLPSGASAQDCLQGPEQPQTPPEVRRFRRSQQPEPGAIRVHHGKAGDPDRTEALVHGVQTKDSQSSSSLLNPPRGSLLQEKLQELREAVYQQRAPLGRSQVQLRDLPPGIHPETTVFGVRNSRGLDVRELLSPDKSRSEVEREAQEAHELYLHSHNHYFVGERINRKYDLPHFRADAVFGLETPHFNDGRSVAQILQWTQSEPLSEGSTGTEAAAGKTFGILPPADQYGAGDMIHRSDPGQFSRGPAPERSLVNAIRHHLKKVNYHLFPSLLQAFRHYDKRDLGLVHLSDLQQVCHEFHLDSSEKVLQQLLDDCDLDRDGGLNFLEFSNFLCWKELMPIKTQDQKILTGERVDKLSSSKALLRPEDLEPLGPSSSLRVPRTLTQTRGDPEAFSPSSTAIGAVSLTASLTASKGLRCGGLPSVRSDLPPPRLKRVSDRTNYGDTPTAAMLLRPHVHAALGVYEEHFLSPRSRQEMAEIFHNIGVELPQPLFDEAWDLAAVRSASGDVCVENFRSVLKELKAM